MKKYFLCSFFVLGFISADAQLADGTIAPDFTLQDINGNTWHLYELLDSGKHVVIDFSATWCGPCWSYHESGALHDLYAMYGPDGTDEFMVFFIEGDSHTNVDCIYDLPGCDDSSSGDWTDGTFYPIINDDFIAWEYEITYWPTIYYICPNKRITEIHQIPTEEIYLLKDECAVAYGDNNVSVVSYDGYSGIFCGTEHITPALLIQNLGDAPLDSFVAELWVNDVHQETVTWTGYIETYFTSRIEFSDITIAGDATLTFIITSVNGAPDDDTTDNQIETEFTALIPNDQNLLQLEIRTDLVPRDTYWEITDDYGNVLYKGGNSTIAGLMDDGGTYTDRNTSYFIQCPVSGDGCYMFSIYDDNGNGLSTLDGYYKLTDANGDILLEGAEFGHLEQKLFGIAGASNPIPNNGSILGISGIPDEFCSNAEYSPVIELMNLGSEPITSAEIEFINEDELIAVTSWTGIISKGQLGQVSLEISSLYSEKDIQIRIKSINGEPDTFAYRNLQILNLNLGWNFAREPELVLEMKLDNYAYEVYWQLTNDAGDVMASGGNTKVGPHGGGAQIASPEDPGAYNPYELVVEQISLPDSINDCYTLLVVDDYGDGFYYQGYARITERHSGAEVVKADYQSIMFATDEIVLDVNPLVSALEPIPSTDQFRVFPNPAQEELKIAISIGHNIPLGISVYNMIGEVVMKLPESPYTTGSNDISLDISTLPNGVYAISIESGGKIRLQKFSIFR